jgi:MFS-type transporter involved in bile tolerance (Atg22 family)
VNAGKFLGPVAFANIYALTQSYGLSFASMVVPAVFGICCLARLDSAERPTKNENEKARMPV